MLTHVDLPIQTDITLCCMFWSPCQILFFNSMFLNPVLEDPQTVHILARSQLPEHLKKSIKDTKYRCAEWWGGSENAYCLRVPEDRLAKYCFTSFSLLWYFKPLIFHPQISCFRLAKYRHKKIHHVPVRFHTYHFASKYNHWTG